MWILIDLKTIVLLICWQAITKNSFKLFLIIIIVVALHLHIFFVSFQSSKKPGKRSEWSGAERDIHGVYIRNA